MISPLCRGFESYWQRNCYEGSKPTSPKNKKGSTYAFIFGFEMRTSLPFRVHISKMKKSTSSIIKVSAIFMLIFHKIHFWKGTPQSSEGIPQPTHSRHLTGIFSARSELKFFSNTARQQNETKYLLGHF